MENKPKHKCKSCGKPAYKRGLAGTFGYNLVFEYVCENCYGHNISNNRMIVLAYSGRLRWLDKNEK